MKSKVPYGEGVAAAGFEIAFKGLGLFESFEGDVGFDFPRQVLRCVRNLSGIVLCQTGAKIGSAANVTLVGVQETAKDGGGEGSRTPVRNGVTRASTRVAGL